MAAMLTLPPFSNSDLIRPHYEKSAFFLWFNPTYRDTKVPMTVELCDLNALELFFYFHTQRQVLPDELLWRKYALRHLHISEKLRFLSATFFQDLTKLKELSLSCEQVKLPKNLPKLLPHLEKLSLNGTRIKGKSKKDIEKWFTKHKCVITF